MLAFLDCPYNGINLMMIITLTDYKDYCVYISIGNLFVCTLLIKTTYNKLVTYIAYISGTETFVVC